MFGVPIWAIKLGAVAIVVSGVWLHGRSIGEDAVLNSLRDDRVTILKDGKEIDNEVDIADDDGLCVLLGGCRMRDRADGN